MVNSDTGGGAHIGGMASIGNAVANDYYKRNSIQQLSDLSN